MSCEGPNTLNPMCLVSNFVADQANAAATSGFSHIAGYFGKAAEHATVWLWQEIDNATTLDLASPELRREMAITGAIAAVLCCGLFVIQVIKGVLRREPGALGRALIGLVTAFIGSALAITATRALLAAVDALSAGVVQQTMGTNVAGIGTKLAAVNLASHSNPATVLLLSIVILVAVVVVWAAMLARKLMLLVAAVLAPIAFAGSVADISRAWMRRWIEFVAAMIAAKLLLVIILSIGVAVLDGAGQTSGGVTQATTQMVGGALVLLMGGFAPWISIKMFTFAGEALHSAHVTAIQSSSGARAVISAPQKVAALASTARSIVPVGAAGGAALAMTAGRGSGTPTKRTDPPDAIDNSPAPGGSRPGGSAPNTPVGAVDRGRVAASANPTTTPSGAPSGSPSAGPPERRDGGSPPPPAQRSQPSRQQPPRQ